MVSSLPKNQHYVWRHYLSAWAEDGKVWCLRAPQQSPFQANLTKVGSETYFYRIYELDANDLAYLEGIISHANGNGLADINRGWIELFQRAFAIRRALGETAIGSRNRAQLDAVLDEIAKSIGEYYHTAIENQAKPLLAQLRAKDAAFFEDDESAMNFVLFIVHQYFRTANMRNRMYRLPRMIPHEPQRTWPIESYIYATNVGASLFAQRRSYRITFLENASETGLIAGDQPVINLNDHNDEHLCLYYPLSPWLSMVLSAEPKRFPEERATIGRLQAETFNFQIHSKSDSQIYSADAAYLQSMAAVPKRALERD